MNKGVYVLGLAAGILIAVYGWFYTGCLALTGPGVSSSCIHSDDGEWTTIFGAVIAIVSAIGLARAFAILHFIVAD